MRRIGKGQKKNGHLCSLDVFMDVRFGGGVVSLTVIVGMYKYGRLDIFPLWHMVGRDIDRHMVDCHMIDHLPLAINLI